MAKINSREKGKRGEREMKNLLKPIFPDIRRNAGTQAQSGGVDLENTEPFDFEVKYGAMYQSKMIQKLIDQVKAEGKVTNYKVLLVNPGRGFDKYAALPLADFVELLEILKKNELI